MGAAQFEREKCVVVGRAGRADPFKPFDIGHRVTGFGVCHVGFQSCFGSVFPYSAPDSSPFGMGMVDSLSLSVGSV